MADEGGSPTSAALTRRSILAGGVVALGSVTSRPAIAVQPAQGTAGFDPARTDDQTVAVQRALETIGARGGTIEIPEGARFNLRNLDFSRTPRVNLEYRADDDLSAGIASSRPASGERVYFSANSSHPADATGGAVNEWRFVAPFHPGLVVEVRKDLAGADAGMARNQSRMNPARASYNILDEENGIARLVYEQYCDAYSPYSGVHLHGWRNKVRLGGVGSAGWPRAPAVNDRVVGTTSRAAGFVKEIRPGHLVVQWLTGSFQPGEHLQNETQRERSSAAITASTRSVDRNIGISMDCWGGGVTIGDGPPGLADETLQLWGNLKIVPSRGGTTNQPRQVQAPTLWWGTDPAVRDRHRLGIGYDPSAGPPRYRRLHMAADDESWRGELVPVSAMVRFTGSLSIEENAVNIARITNPSTGSYVIAFSRPLARAGAVPTVGRSGSTMLGWDAQVAELSVDSCRIAVVNRAGAPANIPPEGYISLLLLGGDI